MLAAHAIPMSGALCTNLPDARHHVTGVLAKSMDVMVAARIVRSGG